MPKRNYCALPILLIASAIFAGSSTDDSVHVDRARLLSTTRFYDPQIPDPRMPATQPDEAGVTISNFTCTAELQGSILRHYAKGTGIVCEVRIDSANVHLGLTVDEWISQTAPQKIVKHEDGHRMIAAHFYSTADSAASAIAAAKISQTAYGVGPDSNAAAKDALTSAASELVQDYMKEVRNHSEEVQEAYDRITAHGTNQIEEIDAIETAMHELAARGPQTRP